MSMFNYKIPVYWDHDHGHDRFEYINGVSRDGLIEYSNKIINHLKIPSNDIKVDMFRQNVVNDLPMDHLFMSINPNEVNGQYMYPLFVSYIQLNSIIWYDGSLDFYNQYLDIPSIILDDCNKKKAKIFLYNLWEGWTKEIWLKIIEKIITKYPTLTVNSFIIGSGNLQLSETIPAVSWCIFEQVANNQIKQLSLKSTKDKIISSIKNRNIRPNKFICLNRKPKSSRFYSMIHLYKFRNDGILTFVFDQNDIPNNTQDPEYFNKTYPSYVQNALKNKDSSYSIILRNFLNYCDKETSKLFNEHDILNQLPLLYKENLDLRSNPALDSNLEKFYDSYLNIVTETKDINENETFITEKVFKAMMCFQPFVVIGTTGILKELKKLGYKTFDKWIDESYDLIEDDKLRWKSAIDSSIKFFNRTDEEILNDLNDMIDILDHNFNQIEKNNKNIEINILTQFMWQMFALKDK